MKDFINPKSMLTPGVAGSLMMFLVNGVTLQFPEIPIRFLALFLSFLIGAIVWASETEGKLAVVQKAIYWVLNSLIIFVVGFGAANLAADATAGGSKVAVSHGLSLPFVSAAFAQGTLPEGSTSPGLEQPQVTSGRQGQMELEDELARQREENRRLKMRIESLQRDEATSESHERERRFFKRW